MITVRHGKREKKTRLDTPLDGSIHMVPCGKCAYCLTNKRSAWIFRMYWELRYQEKPGYFLTFTYDEHHVPRAPDGRRSLRFYDIQLYLKRLRKAKYYAKYVCVGEYGAETKRPHYHMILWTDASPDFIQANWHSSTTKKIMGHVDFGELTIASFMYCMKYIIQPKQLAQDGIEKTRAQFSKGLGLGYLSTSMYEYHTQDYDEPLLFTYLDGKKVALPKYYKDKIFTKAQLRKEAEKTKWQRIKEKRRHKRVLLAQGIKDTEVYLQTLRVERANRIISKTKYGLTV